MRRSAWWTVIALCAAQFMLILDVVVITVAIPSIRTDLGLLDSQIALAATAYTVTFGGLLIVSGRAGDRFGQRPLLLAGLGVFVAASLAAGLSQADWHLFAARALQGIGAAMVSANALAAITASLPEGPARNRALGLWAGVGSAGAIAGQLAGGALTHLLGWRWIFLINIPIGVVVGIALAVLVRRGGGRPARLAAGPSALLVAGLVSGVLGLTWLGEAQTRGRSAVAGLLAAALLTAFVLADRRHPAPLLRLSLLRLPSVRTANITLLLNAGALGATLLFVTLYLQLVLGYSALATGLAFAPITLLILLLSPRAAALAPRVGVRRLLTAGLVLLAAGALLLARLPAGGTYWRDVLPGMLLLAVGSGLAYAPTYIAASSGITDEEHGAASGLINTAQEVGAALGIAVLALVASWAAGGDSPATGYRTGLLGAAALFAVAAAVAARTPDAATVPDSRPERNTFSA